MSSKFFFSLCVVVLGLASITNAQIVEFRLETTDIDGNVIDSIEDGNQFVLTAFTRQSDFAGAPEDGGVFAGYLNVSYDDSLISIAGSVEHGPNYQVGTNADLDTVGLLGDVGGFTSMTEPFGASELQLWSLLMNADSQGELSFVSSESLVLPQFEVLVFGSDERVEAGDIAFGSTTLTIVPEPNSMALMLLGLVGCLRQIAPSRHFVQSDY